MRLRTWCAALWLASTSLLAADKPALTAEEEARALIGMEYTLGALGDRIAPDRLSCTDEGGGLLFIDGISSHDWSEGTAKCRGRMVVMLLRTVAEENGYKTLRIVDTLFLPPVDLEWNPKRRNTLQLARTDDGLCKVRERPDTSFVVLLRWGKRERIDWRTGVEQAWTFDIKQGRIVPLSTKSIVCEWFEP